MKIDRQDKISFRPGDRALAIVAHPDDETIFLGGTILAHPQVQWTILSLCRASDADRAPKFHRVCAHFGAQAMIMDMEDEGLMNIEATALAARGLIEEALGDDRDWDVVISHGANGEYRHPRHIGVHLAVKSLWQSHDLRARELYWLCHRRRGPRQAPYFIPRSIATVVMPTSGALLAEKKRIMSEIYGFAPDGIDTNYCSDPEAFIRHNRR